MPWPRPPAEPGAFVLLTSVLAQLQVLVLELVAALVAECTVVGELAQELLIAIGLVMIAEGSLLETLPEGPGGLREKMPGPRTLLSCFSEHALQALVSPGL